MITELQQQLEEALRLLIRHKIITKRVALMAWANIIKKRIKK